MSTAADTRTTPSYWAMRSRSRVATVAVVVVLGVLAAACGGPPSEVSWRNLQVPIPDGWHVFEETDDRLSIANVDLATLAENGELPDEDVVAMFFTHEPSTLPADWRSLLTRRDAELETDDRLELGDDIPATRLIYSFVSADVPTREMVVLIPSREVVVLAQPVPRPGQVTGPEVFMEHIGDFMGVLDGILFGRPVVDGLSIGDTRVLGGVG